MVARQAHNLEAGGPNPSPATESVAQRSRAYVDEVV